MNPKFLRYPRLVVLFLFVICPQAIANEEKAATKDQADPSGGMMLSDGLVNAMLKRAAYELSSTLELDDAQSTELTQTLNKRWGPFFNKHRKELSPIVDRMMQAMWDPELPSADEAQAWAKQAIKMHEIFTEQVEKSNQDVAKLLNPVQLAKFKKRAAQFNMGLDMFKVELQKMEQGQLAETMWAHRRLRREERRRRWRQEREERFAQQMPPSPELTAVSVSMWEKYVIEFVEKFGLDEAQKAAANNILDDIKHRATQYVNTHAEELKQVKSELSGAAKDRSTQIMKQHKVLLEPLKNLFAELQTRLDHLPTEAQRNGAKAEEEASNS